LTTRRHGYHTLASSAQTGAKALNQANKLSRTYTTLLKRRAAARAHDLRSRFQIAYAPRQHW
jgi:hypothetical protein